MTKPEYFKGSTRLGDKAVRWESTFPIGTTYGCEQCGICCNGWVDLSPKDIELLKKDGLGECISYSNAAKGSTPSRPHMRFDNNGTCCLLANKKCTAYNSRPVICRGYPIKLAPGFEGDLIADVILRCLYVGVESEPQIKRSDIMDCIDTYKEHLPRIMARVIEHRKTLADHVRAAYPPAFLPRARKLEFMDSAIDRLQGAGGTMDALESVRAWADSVTQASHEVFVHDCKGIVAGKEQEREILSKLPKAMQTHSYALSKTRWKNVFDDINRSVFLTTDAGVQKLPVNAGWRVKIGDKHYNWNQLTKLVYSDEAMAKVIDYMKLNVRRVNFQLTVAYIAEHIADQKRMAITDYELEATILANAVMVYLDPLSRAVAVWNEEDSITGEDVRLAASNMDAWFVTAMTSGQLTSELIKRIDAAFPG